MNEDSYVIPGDQRHKFQPFVTIDERDVTFEDDGNEEDGGDKKRQANEDCVHANVVSGDATLQDAAMAKSMVVTASTDEAMTDANRLYDLNIHKKTNVSMVCEGYARESTHTHKHTRTLHIHAREQAHTYAIPYWICWLHI